MTSTDSKTDSPVLSMQTVRETAVAPGHVALWWLGQAGFLIKSAGGKIVALDPYLSNSCKSLGDEVGFDMERIVPPPLLPQDLVGIDLYALTHSHRDHLDPQTLEPYLAAGGEGPFLAPAETALALAHLGVVGEQIEMVWPNKTRVVGDLTWRATFAIPFGGDDLTHVGYLVFVDEGPTLYFTGDTAYHDVIADSVAPHKPDVMITVINGAFRNMGPDAAAHLAKQIDPQIVIPCHHDLFRDNIQPPQMLRTNLHILGIGEKYRLLEHGRVWMFPE